MSLNRKFTLFRHAEPQWWASAEHLGRVVLVGSRTVLAFVGENENGALAVGSRELLAAMKPQGIDGHVINLHDPQWMTELGRFANAGVLFAFGFAGIGAGLAHVDPTTRINRNFWDTVRVPFISILADQPSHQPRNHRVPARYVVNGYVFRDFFDLQRRLIRSPQVSVVLPQACGPNPHRDKTPWSRRTHRMVFVKSGGDPVVFRAQWAQFPTRLRAILEEASDEVLRRSAGDISELVLSCFEAHGIDVGERHELLFAVLQQVDLYVRLVRATRMAQALCRVPAEIIGARWDHIDKTGAKARFLPAVNAAVLPELFADTQFIVNTTPNFSGGTHERVLYGFTGKACVISDDNDFTRRRFAAVPSYFGFDWIDPDWADRIAARFADHESYDDRMQPALDLVENEFSPAKLSEALTETAELMRLGEGFAPLGYVDAA
jgi:hypothetical protein